ncbi:MAG: hypothetical protein RMY29_007845 [Nostoc sp. CreGUA01]|nr:hypothetical protein [Nostoc sp. CreGUA01]
MQNKLGLTQTLQTLGVLGVLAVAYGKPQSVYDKLGKVGYFCVSPISL